MSDLSDATCKQWQEEYIGHGQCINLNFPGITYECECIDRLQEEFPDVYQRWIWGYYIEWKQRLPGAN